MNVIAGAALGGVLAAGPGPQVVYGLDTVSFAVSFWLLYMVRPLAAARASRGPAERGRAAQRGGRAGLRARAPDLLGSYLADLAAMTFAYPNALFPFVAADLHAALGGGADVRGAVGRARSRPPCVSGWMGRVRRHGLAIAVAAGLGAADHRVRPGT